MKFPKPIVVVSKCLEFEAVRYNGAVIKCEWIEKMKPFVKFVPICPEIEIGLGVPRDPIRIVFAKGKENLVQPSTGLVLNARMRSFAVKFLGSLKKVDGFILKARSPSCGIRETKKFTDGTTEKPSGKTLGFFARAVKKKFPRAAVVDETDLEDSKKRRAFMKKLFRRAGSGVPAELAR